MEMPLRLLLPVVKTEMWHWEVLTSASFMVGLPMLPHGALHPCGMPRDAMEGSGAAPCKQQVTGRGNACP